MIRVGIGGWDFEDWRKNFYPPGLRKEDTLHYASRKLTAIEINATFYRTQSPETYRRWVAETPESFRFSVKAHRSVTAPAKIGVSAERVRFFLDSGVLELGEKLGPLVWQMPPNKKFDREDMAAFLKLLPPEAGGRRLMHAVEVRHESFVDPAFVEMAGNARVAIVYADSDDYPAIADLTGDFVYARLQRSSESEPAGYALGDLDRWAQRAEAWAAGGAPEGLRYVGGSASLVAEPREVFVYFISGAKARNPAAAMALIERLGPGNQAAGGAEEIAAERAATAARRRSGAGSRASAVGSRAKPKGKGAPRTPARHGGRSAPAGKTAAKRAPSAGTPAAGRTANKPVATKASKSRTAKAGTGKTGAAAKSSAPRRKSAAGRGGATTKGKRKSAKA
jgi:uncharacterized protein YecE (DUF72 family)